MFVHFLPLILASITLSFLVLDPERTPGWLELSFFQFNSFLFLGSVLLGQMIPWFSRLKRNGNHGSFTSSHLSPSRILNWLLWFWLIHAGTPDFWIRNNLQWDFPMESISIFLLLISYWIADALSSNHIRQLGIQDLREKVKMSFRHSRIQLPILLLGTLESGWLFMLRHFDHSFLEISPLWFELLSSVLILFIAAPPILIHSWGAKSLESSEAKTLIIEELKQNKVPVRSIRLWPEEVLPHSTAGVIGIIPGFRYLMISRKLMEFLNKDELKSVVAHEAGHLRKKHLLFFAIAMLGFMVLAQIILTGLTLSFPQSPIIQESYLILPLWLVGLLIFIRFGFGFLSRNFERQADCNAFSRNGLTPIANALFKVSWINAIDPERSNWHHWGIRERVNFLKQCEEDPQKINRHHHRVSKIQVGCLMIVSLLLTGNLYLESSNFKILWLNQQLESQRNDWNIEHQPRMRHLADLLFFDEQYELSERWYRRALDIDPQDPYVLNNLSWLLSQVHEKDEYLLAESILLVEKALQKKEAAFIWDTAAEVYWKSGKTDAAKNAAQNALLLAEKGEGISNHQGIEYYHRQLKKFSETVFAP